MPPFPLSIIVTLLQPVHGLLERVLLKGVARPMFAPKQEDLSSEVYHTSGYSSSSGLTPGLGGTTDPTDI